MENCIFCSIISGDIPAEVLYSDEKVLAFRDVNAQAPEHFLVIPKEHIATANDCLLYTSPSPRDRTRSRMPSSA